MGRWGYGWREWVDGGVEGAGRGRVWVEEGCG